MKFSILIGFLWASVSLAAIPKSSLILQRLSENAGSGVYQIDQELQFPNGQDILVLKETWMIENENNLKLIVTGAKELKDQVAFSIQVSGGTHSVTKKRVSEDFIERYFHIRSAEVWAQTLGHLKLTPANVLSHKPPRSLKDIDNQPESFVRLARSGGVVTYAFGGLSSAENEAPGFWVEQDQFVLRKFRLPSLVEVTADRFSPYSKGMNFPRTRTVRWGSNQVTIQTISVSARSKEAFASFGLKGPTKMEALNNLPAAAIIEDFYKRFR